MSKQIEERVVSMQFDNSRFERNVSQSMSTLDKLKQKLNLSGASKGLENVQTAASKVDMHGLANNVETVRARFSALEVMGVTALANITNSAVNAGKQLVKSFTVDPIKSGFQEYETQINAVQTILANTESKGSTLQDVNRALAELNTYADKTIYNFTEMTRNIGTFTAAGVDLKTSVSAIKGIANLAAVSGSSSQQASTAMYQLSQALASGTVKLMDWNSVVNAGMGGQVFQDALKETARVHGIAIDSMIKEEGSFRETLQKGWLTSEILTETLNHFTMAAEEGTEEWESYKKSLMDTGYSEAQAEAILKMANTATDAATKVKTFSQLMDTLKESAQSGWTKSWEIMIGDFEEAKGFLTDVSDRLGAMIGESADTRNKMLSGGLSSGWKQLLDAGIADEEGYKDMFKSVAKEHGVSIDDMIAAEKKLDDSLSDSEAFQKALKTGFKDGSLSADYLSESVHKMADKMSNMSAKQLEAAGYTKEHVKQIKDLSAGLKDGSISMDDFVKKIGRTSGRENIIQALWNAFDGLMSVITPIKEAFRDIFPATTGEQLYRLTERIRDFTAKLKLSDEQSANLKATFKGLFSIIKIGVTAVKAVVGGIVNLIGKFTGLGGGILSVTGSLGDWISGVAKSVTETNIFAKVINKIVDVLGKVIDKFKEFGSFIKSKFEAPGFETFLNILNTIWSGIKKVGMAVIGVASSIGKALGNAFRNGDMKSLLDLVNGGIITAILLKLKSWVSGFKDLAGEGKGFVQSIKDVLSTVGDALKTWQDSIKVNMIKNIAIAIAILAASLWVLSGIDPDKLGSALGAITVLFMELIGALKAFDKLGIASKGAGKAAVLMIGMSLAVLILASALKKIAELDWDAMGRGLVGVGALLVELIGAAKLMSIGGKNISKGAIQMILMAAALKIMASVCEDLSKLGWEELGKGVAGIGGILLIFAGFAELIKLIKPEKMMSSALSLILIGAAMEIFADVCSKFGQMEWAELGKAGAAIAGILLIAAGFGKLSSYAGKMVSSSIALILIGAAMEIFADVCSKFGGMEWEALAKAGVAIGGILLLSAGFAKLSSSASKMTKSVICLTIIAAAMEIFADVCKKFGGMDWSALGKAGAAIGGILLLAVGFSALAGKSEGILKSAASLLVMAVSLKLLVPVLTTLGSMSWESIAKGLITLAAGLAIFIGAAFLINKFKLTAALYSLAGAIALFGLGCLMAGAGVAAFAVGFGMLAGTTAAGATAIVAALHIIIVGILDLIPAIIESLTRAVVALCQVFIQCVPAIGEAIRVFVLEIIKIFVECVPALADGLLKTVVGVLEALVRYTPQIVDLVFDFLIAVLEGIARKLPALIQSVVNVFKALFSGVIDALNSMDPEMLVKGILGIGFMITMMAALAAMAALAPAAMIGVLGFGAVITELAAVLAVLGGLAQIPGLEWLISEGGNFLQTVGTAIGKFLGGIIGGFAQGMSASLPQIGADLSSFMTNAMPFIIGAKMIDAASLEGVRSLVDIILLLTGANILEGLTSWFTGGSSLTKFGEEIAAFAPSIKTYADTVKGIDAAAVEASASAAKCLSELASGLPNSGGVVGWFAGENDLDVFAEQLPKLGTGLLAFSVASTGINPETVTAAANAAKSIAEMASIIPNEGGVAAWFAGDNSIASFGDQLPKLGAGLLAFSVATTGINPEGVTAAAGAAKAIAEMASVIPNEGGVAAWFAGDNSIASFASQLPVLGGGLLGFSIAVSGINPENVIAAAGAAKALAEMASVIPNEGGMVAWFTGDNSVASFAQQLPVLGAGLLGFSMSLFGIVPENIIAGANAAKALAEMASVIPNEGGMVAWFTGDNSLANFAGQLPILGAGLLGFSIATMGINPETVTAAANAAKTLAEITTVIPNEGGIKAWFSGESGIASFASQLPILGAGLLGFSISATGVNAEAVASAANAAKSVAEITSVIPNEGGIKSWFSGETGIASFASQLPILGAGLLGFSIAAAGIKAEAVAAATTAAKNLAELTNIIPNEGGIKAWFSGESGLAKFSSNLPALGKGLLEFSKSVEGIVPENVTVAADAAKKLGEMVSVLPENSDSLESFGKKLKAFGEKLSEYFTSASGISAESITASNNAVNAITELTTKIKPDSIKSASSAIETMINTLKKVSKIKESSTDGFSKALGKIAKNSADAIIKQFTDMHSKIESAGKTLMGKFVDGVNKKEKAVESASETLAEAASKALSDKKSAFETAGEDCAKGFANGIKSKSVMNSVISAATSLGKAALKAAKEALDENSPSKEMYKVGDFAGVGFVNALYDNVSQAYKAGTRVADSAKLGISKAVARISDIVNSDIDAQPTIRPVLDLSDVRAGAGSMNALFSGRTLSVDMAGVGSVSASMAKFQNGSDSKEIVSSIKALRKDIADMPRNSYTINGVTYDDGTNVSDAVGSLVRAIKIERRT